MLRDMDVIEMVIDELQLIDIRDGGHTWHSTRDWASYTIHYSKQGFTTNKGACWPCGIKQINTMNVDKNKRAPI